LLLIGCRTTRAFGPFYPLPEQRPSFANERPFRHARIIDIADTARSRFLNDSLASCASSWCWTRQHPRVTVKLPTRDNLRYTIDFTIVEQAIKDTGPVELSFEVNRQVLDRVRYDSPGPKHFEHPVPPEWIEPNQATEVS